MQNIFKHQVQTPIGKINLLSTEKGLCYVGLPKEGDKGWRSFAENNFPDARVMPGGPFNRTAARQLSDYFKGKLKIFNVNLDLRADGFGRRVLQKVKSIPYGQTRTYGEIARSLGKPGAARAVGGANAKNPIPVLIPCHRVVASNGLGGYGGGISLKKKLLRHEGLTVTRR